MWVAQSLDGEKLKSQNSLSWQLFISMNIRMIEPIVQEGSQCVQHKIKLPLEGEYHLFWVAHLCTT